jgi:hypothetical protein
MISMFNLAPGALLREPVAHMESAATGEIQRHSGSEHVGDIIPFIFSGHRALSEELQSPEAADADASLSMF